MILGSSTATIATIIGAAGVLSVVLFKKWNKEINAYFILCANFVFNALLIFGMTGFLGGIVPVSYTHLVHREFEKGYS